MANVTYGGMVTQGNDLYQEYVVDGKSYWLKEGDPRVSGFADWNEFAGTLTPDDMMAPEERTTPGGATPEPVVPVQPFGSRDVISLPGDWDPIQYLVNNPDVKAAGVDPGQHWITHGEKEGRSYAKPSNASSGLDSIRSEYDAQYAKWQGMNAELAAQIAALQNYKFQMPEMPAMPEYKLPEFPTAPEPPEMPADAPKRKSRIRALTLLTSGGEQGTQATKLGVGGSMKAAKAKKTLLGA